MNKTTSSATAPTKAVTETVSQEAVKTEQPRVKMTIENSVVKRMAKSYGLQEKNLLQSLKTIIFHDPKVGDNEVMAFLLVADKYGLDPWTRQIYPALTKQGAILPVVGVDGWCAILNNHPQMDGMEVITGSKKPMSDIVPRHKDAGLWLKLEAPEEITVKIYRKDRKYPIVVSESMAECFRETEPWKTHPARMLRHKAIIQAARVAFGFTGIYDPDEAERINESYKGPVEVIKRPIYEERAMTLETFVKAIIDRVQAKNAPMDAVMNYLRNPDFNLSKEDLEYAQKQVAIAQNSTGAMDDAFVDIEPLVIKEEVKTQTEETTSEVSSEEPTEDEENPTEELDELFGATEEK